MRIAVMGSGGLGGYFGARLSHGGAEVHFIARGKHLQAMRSEGLRIEGPDAIVLPRVSATDNPDELGTVDVVIVRQALGHRGCAAPNPTFGRSCDDHHLVSEWRAQRPILARRRGRGVVPLQGPVLWLDDDGDDFALGLAFVGVPLQVRYAAGRELTEHPQQGSPSDLVAA